MKNNDKMLTEAAIQKDEQIVARIKNAKPTKSMTSGDFLAWLSQL